MRSWTLCKRTAKEIVRDPLTVVFGIGFPVAVLLLLTAIQANIPVALFEIENLTPGIAVFGLSFMTLFTATLVAKDRESALLSRLYTTPLRAIDFILGYILPVLPVALAQTTICYLLALCLGLSWTVNILWAIAFTLPVALFFIAVGVLCGSLMGVKPASGLCGGLFTNLSAWLSGTWFDLALVGGAFQTVASLFPFVHAVDMGRAVIGGAFGNIFPHLYWILGYAVVALFLSVVAFLRQMKK